MFSEFSEWLLCHYDANRHCLWILGNEKQLSNGDSIWEDLICDAKVRGCFFNADDDKNLLKVIMEVKRDLNQLEDLLDADSVLFRNARWKVLVLKKLYTLLC